MVNDQPENTSVIVESRDEHPLFGGVHCVLYALFDQHGTLDLGAMKAQAQLMLDQNVDGMTVLGLATEAQKLSLTEQQAVISAVAQVLDGRCPYSVTISGNSIAQQSELAHYALDQGADWLILQPPIVGHFSGETYLDFFSAVAEEFSAPFAIQNAPQYLGRALSAEDVEQLKANHDNFSLIKAEISAVSLADFIRSAGRDLTILNGRGGLELTDCLRAGADGFVLAPDVCDYSKRMFDLYQSGKQKEMDALYSEVLPAIVFMMQSLEHLICYGKRLFAARAGMIVYDRSPALAPTQFGLEITQHWANRLGVLD